MAKVKTGFVRLSYPHLAEPRPSSDGGAAKYGVTLLISKDDKSTLTAIKNAIETAAEDYRAKNGAQSLPAKPKTTLHDGDGEREDGTEYGPECKGCYIITANTVNKPLLIDQRRQEVLEDIAETFYPGCYVVAILNFKGYNFNGKKGITAYLNGLQFAKDGDPLGDTGAKASDFDALAVEVTDDDDFFA